MIKQGNAEKVHKGVKSDTVGPGQYEVNKGVTPGKKGPTWHLPKSKPKVPTSSDRTSIPGPGHYNAEKVDVFPIYKYKPSSVFVSKVDRDK